MKNVIAICGLETIQADDNVTHPDTFLDNVLTWKRDHKSDHVSIIDARNFIDNNDPMGSLWDELKAQSQAKPIDILLYSGHSGSLMLYVFLNTRQDLDDVHRLISMGTDWDEVKFSPVANVWLMGCQTGGQEGAKFDVCIAQDIATKTRATVWGFVYKSSQQHRKDGGWEMRPEHGDYVKFSPSQKH